MPEEEVKEKTTKAENTGKKFRFKPTNNGTTMTQITSSKVNVRLPTTIIYKNTKIDQVINDYVRSKYKEYSPYQFIKYYNQNSSSFKQDGVPYFLYPSFTVALSCRRRRNARLDTTLCISKQRVL